MGAILLAQHPHSHHRTKHFDIRTSYIREKREDKTVSFNHISSKDNKADILTKGINPAQYFLKQRQDLGMAERTSTANRVGVTEIGASPPRVLPT